MMKTTVTPYMCVLLAGLLMLCGCQSVLSSDGGPVTRDEFDNLRQRVDNLENITVGRKINQIHPGAPTPPPAGGLSTAPGGPPVLPPAQATPAPSGSDRSLYQRGQSYLKQKQFNQAAAIFSQMLAQNPGGALAPNARYWLGECHYAQGSFREAAAEFERCANDYPQSAKAPDSLLKLSYSYDRLHDGPRAMAVLDILLSRYPSSNAAAMIKNGRGRFSASLPHNYA